MSTAVDIVLFLREIAFYRTQLGLPGVGSVEVKALELTTQVQVRSLWLTTTGEAVKYLLLYHTESAVEEVVRFAIPALGSVIASGMSFAATYLALKSYLKRLEETVLLTLEEAAQKSIKGIN